MENVVQVDRPQMTIEGRMNFAYWIPKATDTHLENIILTPFPLLYYTYIACLFFFSSCIYYVSISFHQCSVIMFHSSTTDAI